MALNDKFKADAAAHAGLTYPAGTRVLDTVTGFTGTIVSGHVRRVPVPVAQQSKGQPTQGALGLPEMQEQEFYSVRLDDNEPVDRSGAHLVPIPANVEENLEGFI